MTLRTCALVAFSCMVGAVAAQGQSIAPTAGAPIRIGVVGPFTGPSADFGRPIPTACAFVIDEINSFGATWAGSSFRAVVKDDQATLETGKKMSAELIGTDKVVAAIGFCNTGVAMAAIDSFQAAKVPLIVPCATGSPITTVAPPAESYIFRNSPKDAIQAPFVVDDLVARGWTRVPCWPTPPATACSGPEGRRAGLGEEEPQGRLRRPLPDRREGPRVGRASSPRRAAGANVVFSYTVGPENAVVARGRQALGWKSRRWRMAAVFSVLHRWRKKKRPKAHSWRASSPSRATSAAAPSSPRTCAIRHQEDRGADGGGPGLRRYLPAGAGDAEHPGGKLDGPAIKASLENPKRTHYGVVNSYERPFSSADHDALTQNMLVMGIGNGSVTFAYPEDAKKRNSSCSAAGSGCAVSRPRRAALRSTPGCPLRRAPHPPAAWPDRHAR